MSYGALAKLLKATPFCGFVFSLCFMPATWLMVTAKLQLGR
jgi:hypothetical protein